MKCQNYSLIGVEVPGKDHPNTTRKPCPREAAPGLIWCRECLHQEAERVHAADKERWAQEAEWARHVKIEEGNHPPNPEPEP